MVILDEPLELQEIASEAAAPAAANSTIDAQQVTPIASLPSIFPPTLSSSPTKRELVPTEVAPAPTPLALDSANLPASPSEPGPSGDETPATQPIVASSVVAIAEVESPESSGALALDSEIAVEFFSQRPPPPNFAAEIEHDAPREMVRVRSSEQIARQRYLRGLVLKVMLVAVVFVVAVVFYLLWQRGHQRLI